MREPVASSELPAPVAELARGAPDPTLVRAVYSACLLGGESAASVARRHGCHGDTARKWLHKLRELDLSPGEPEPLTPDQIPVMRAKLLAQAESTGDLAAQLRIIDAESKRLGVDTPGAGAGGARALAQLPPEERARELAQRLARLGLAPDPGQLAAAPGAAAPGEPDPSPGGTPPGPRPTPQLSPHDFRATNFGEDGERQPAPECAPVEDSSEEQRDAYDPRSIPDPKPKRKPKHVPYGAEESQHVA